jgi:aspartate kinase
MKVLKFGGTSVGSVKNMQIVKDIIADGSQKIVVLSAMSGTTNTLVSIANDIFNKEPNEAVRKIQNLHESYFKTVNKLIYKDKLNAEVKAYITEVFNFLTEATYSSYSKSLENEILAQGELISTYMFNAYLNQEGISSTLLPALDFMKINDSKDPDFKYIKEQFPLVIKNAP